MDKLLEGVHDSWKNNVKQKIKTMPQVLHGDELMHRTFDEGNWPCLGKSAVGTKYVLICHGNIGTKTQSHKRFWKIKHDND